MDLLSGERAPTGFDCIHVIYRDRQFFLLPKPFLDGRMRFVAIETDKSEDSQLLKHLQLPVIIS